MRLEHGQDGGESWNDTAWKGALSVDGCHHTFFERKGRTNAGLARLIIATTGVGWTHERPQQHGSSVVNVADKGFDFFRFFVVLLLRHQS